METKVFSKNDILQKLAQDGFFVDYLTLGSFLQKYKIEAIFEDENGNEFFDKSAYDVLVSNVLKKPFTTDNQESQNSLGDAGYKPDFAQNSGPSLQNFNTPTGQPVLVSNSNQTFTGEDSKGLEVDKKASLENIKWYRWDDVSADFANDKPTDDVRIIDSGSENTNKESSSDSQHDIQLQFAKTSDETVFEHENVQTQENYWSSSQNPNQDTSDFVQKDFNNEIEHNIATELSSTDENEDDFDDIGLLSDSIQAQEKFQKYIVNELAKKNIDVTPPKQENAFKFDISEKTLNMIARAIAKKIAKQVSAVLSNEDRNSTKLIQAEKKSQILEQKITTLEEQNRKLKLLLAESNKNLNSYKPTFFGFYRFVRKKAKK